MKQQHIIGVILLSLAINFIGTYLALKFFTQLFLDTIGTMLAAALLGPWFGCLVGLLTNTIQGIVHTSVSIPFALVNCAIGIVTGYLVIALKGYQRWYAPLIIGTVAALIAPVLAAPIATYMFGGITGHGVDKLVASLVDNGQSILQSAFWGRMPNSFSDKILSAYLGFFLIKLIKLIKRKNKSKTGKSILCA